MNCRPNQLAWIVVPRGFCGGSGIEAINGQVVRTLAVVPGYEPLSWWIAPAPSFTLMARMTWLSKLLNPGDQFTCVTLPDAWLRPFDPRSTPQGEHETLPVGKLLALPVVEQTL